MNEPLPPEIPGVRAMGVPSQYLGHPLLNAGPFFTLPEGLLDKIVVRVGGDRFDDELLEMEYALSNVCGSHGCQIGFWGGQPINFLLLRPNSDLTGEFLVHEMSRWGKTRDEAREVLDLAGQRLDWTGLDCQGPPWLLRMADDQSSFP